VVVSDYVGMRAVSNPYEQLEATVATLRAGCDMISIASYLTSTDRDARVAYQRRRQTVSLRDAPEAR
jgi:beta-glucosidase-like glycosyl hydrolase